MTSYVSPVLRRQVIARAGNCCEYCRQSQDYTPFSFHVEHIIAEKHGGGTVLDNLGLSCPDCNAYKGSDIGSIDWDGDGQLTPLYNPRTQLWEDHFKIDSNTAGLKALSPEGRVTISLLRLNSDEQIAARRLLLRLKRYPC